MQLSRLPELDWRKDRQTGILEGILSRSAVDVAICFERMVDGNEFSKPANQSEEGAARSVMLIIQVGPRPIVGVLEATSKGEKGGLTLDFLLAALVPYLSRTLQTD